MKLKRFCEKCGKELIYITLPNDKLATCEWEGPVPFVILPDKEKNTDNYVVHGGRIVAGSAPQGDDVTGYGYKIHRCAQ